MKQFLIMADTHGNIRNIKMAMRAFTGIDGVMHLGDYERDVRYVRTLTKSPVYAVRGNCDIASSEEAMRIVTVEGKRILMVHGNKQKVKSGLLQLGLYAQEMQVDAALFGHSHLPAQEMYSNIVLYNPGSLGEPRMLRPSVGIMTVADGLIKIRTHTF